MLITYVYEVTLTTWQILEYNVSKVYLLNDRKVNFCILIIAKMVHNDKRATKSLLGVSVVGLDAGRTQLFLSVNNNFSSIFRFKIPRFKVENPSSDWRKYKSVRTH